MRRREAEEAEMNEIWNPSGHTVRVDWDQCQRRERTRRAVIERETKRARENKHRQGTWESDSQRELFGEGNCCTPCVTPSRASCHRVNRTTRPKRGWRPSSSKHPQRLAWPRPTPESQRQLRCPTNKHRRRVRGQTELARGRRWTWATAAHGRWRH